MNFKRGTLAHAADEQGNLMSTAGLALETLAGLLEDDLHEKRLYGITCAISLIGTLVREAGFTLCNRAEQEVGK